MCGRYTITTPGWWALAERFAVGDDFEPSTLERYNVCPTEPIAIVAAEGKARVVRAVRRADGAPRTPLPRARRRLVRMAQSGEERRRADPVPLHDRQRRAIRVR